MENSEQSPYRLITIIFLILCVLTGVEYWLGALENPSAVFLMIIAFAKAALVVYFFMHIYRLWRGDEH